MLCGRAAADFQAPSLGWPALGDLPDLPWRNLDLPAGMTRYLRAANLTTGRDFRSWTCVGVTPVFLSVGLGDACETSSWEDGGRGRSRAAWEFSRPRIPARLPGVCVLRVGAARLEFPRPPFVAFGKTLEFRVLLGAGVGRRNGLQYLEFKKQRQMRRAAPPKHLRPVWPQLRADPRGVWALGAARCGGAEAGSSRVPGAARADPRGAGEATATRYFSQGPGLYWSPGSTAEGTQKKKEDAAGKRGAEAG